MNETYPLYFAGEEGYKPVCEEAELNFMLFLLYQEAK